MLAENTSFTLLVRLFLKWVQLLWKT